jgi:acyl-CoA synthetase (AMP-forming)/AMP-acid ligase II
MRDHGARRPHPASVTDATVSGPELGTPEFWAASRPDSPAVVHGDSVLIGIPHDDFGEKPLVFIVANPADRPTPNELLDFLDGRLASYKRPRQFEFVDELHLSPMGKILKTELRGPYWEGRERRV